MITEVIVNCRCWHDGLTGVPPVHVAFVEGRLGPVVPDDQEAFDVWSKQACEHPRMATFVEAVNSFRFDELAPSLMAATDGEFPNLVAKVFHRGRQVTSPARSQLLIDELRGLHDMQPTTAGFELVDVETGTSLMATEQMLSQTLGSSGNLAAYFAAGNVRFEAARVVDWGDGCTHTTEAVELFRASEFTIEMVKHDEESKDATWLLTKSSDLELVPESFVGSIAEGNRLEIANLVESVRIPVLPKLGDAMGDIDLTTPRRLAVRYGAVAITLCWKRYFDVIEGAANASVATGNPIAWIGWQRVAYADRAAMHHEMGLTFARQKVADW